MNIKATRLDSKVSKPLGNPPSGATPATHTPGNLQSLVSTPKTGTSVLTPRVSTQQVKGPSAVQTNALTIQNRLFLNASDKLANKPTGTGPNLKSLNPLVTANTATGSPVASMEIAKFVEDFHHLDGLNTGTVTQDTLEEHMGHHKEWGEFFNQASEDNALSEKDRANAKTQAAANTGRYSRMYQMDQNYNAFTLGKKELTEKDIMRVSALDGNASDISQKDIDAARAYAQAQGIELTPPDPKHHHEEAPATPVAQLPAGEMSTLGLTKTLYQIDNKTRGNSLEKAAISKFVDTQKGIDSILRHTADRGEYNKYDLSELETKTAGNLKNGKYLLHHFNALAPADMKNNGGNRDTLSIEDLKTTAANDGNAKTLSHKDLQMEKKNTKTSSTSSLIPMDSTMEMGVTPGGSNMQQGTNKPTFDRTLDRSLVPPEGLNANNIEAYAGKLSQKFGFSKALILAQVKAESGAEFKDLSHRGDIERTHDQGGPSVGPNQITEGVLLGGIWYSPSNGIDLTPQEAENNPALAMQAGLIHLSDFVRDTGSIEMALRGYVGHDQDQYLANIRKYGGDI